MEQEGSFNRGTSSRLSQSFASFTRKLSSFRAKEYNKVEDLYDTRIPLHNEDVFEHGLRFKSKYIGSLEIARPTCKVDIITAMRRIRYEYKVKGIRKTRAYIQVSTSGVKVSKRKSKRKRKQYSEEQLFVMSHPIYRIFYVSHDSQDLKIFSYITREVPNNTFRCNVFKAYTKKMALHIVRSLGQAFDVCHKLNPKPKKKAVEEEPTEPSEEAKEAEQEATTPKEWKQFNSDIDENMEKLSLDKPEMDLTAELGFDPFASPNTTTEFPDPFTPLSHPSLGVGNSTSLPDYPLGVDPKSVVVPPAHMHLLTTTTQASGQNRQQTIRENPFTDGRDGRESPISIGESIETPGKSNPFDPRSGEGEMAALRKQLQQETEARIQSQARVEQLLSQNQQLLAQLEKLMNQLTQFTLLNMQQVENKTESDKPSSSTPIGGSPVLLGETPISIGEDLLPSGDSPIVEGAAMDPFSPNNS